MTFLNRKISTIKKQTEITISKNKLENSVWIKINQNNNKETYTFLSKNKLIISINGEGFEATWEFVVDSDTLIIKVDKVTIYNCYIVHDEFMILNKDTTEEYELFGNLTKYKNKSLSEIENNFTKLFESVAKNKTINTMDTIFIVQLYILQDILRRSKEKNKAKRLINSLVYDKNSGKVFSTCFRDIFGFHVAHELINSKFSYQDKIEISKPLIKQGIIKINK